MAVSRELRRVRDTAEWKAEWDDVREDDSRCVSEEYKSEGIDDDDVDDDEDEE
jgi:hypothetical protein